MKKPRGKAIVPPQPTERPRKAPHHSGGFSQSHGYGPGHGGPSSPGDVPADETTTGPARVVPTPESDELDA